jgi:hypothetical protein
MSLADPIYACLPLEAPDNCESSPALRPLTRLGPTEED